MGQQPEWSRYIYQQEGAHLDTGTKLGGWWEKTRKGKRTDKLRIDKEQGTDTTWE